MLSVPFIWFPLVQCLATPESLNDINSTVADSLSTQLSVVSSQTLSLSQAEVSTKAISVTGLSSIKDYTTSIISKSESSTEPTTVAGLNGLLDDRSTSNEHSTTIPDHSIALIGNSSAGQLLDEQLRNLTGSLDANDSSALLSDKEKSYFLTFEEWKKRKVAEESVEKLKKNEEIAKQRKIRKSSEQRGDNYLEAPVGEDMEFEASLFNDEDDEDENARKEDGKIYKGRFNYASFDCAATIVKTNKEAKGANAILNENKDTYLLNQCKAPNKFIIIELCEDILVDEILLGNYEFFSSVFKDFKVSVTDRFPTNDWKVIGTFKAENLRKLQVFKVENPAIWARFLKIEFLNYYGNEFYCPVSSVQVHGKTMMEQFKEEAHETPTGKVRPKLGLKYGSATAKADTATTNITQPVLDLSSMKEPKNCMIKPHLGLEEFLKGRKKSEGELCLTNDDTNHTEIESSAGAHVQESIYRNIIKRLSILESNATLSLLYIEQQSKVLSEAFETLEERQNGKFNRLIGQLNNTIHSQIYGFKKMNVELSANFEQFFNYQNDRFQQIMSTSEGRLDQFQRSLSFQKKINFFNMMIIVFLLAYIISGKDTLESDYYSYVSDSESDEDLKDSKVENYMHHASHPSASSSVSNISSLADSIIPRKGRSIINRFLHPHNRDHLDSSVKKEKPNNILISKVTVDDD